MTPPVKHVNLPPFDGPPGLLSFPVFCLTPNLEPGRPGIHLSTTLLAGLVFCMPDWQSLTSSNLDSFSYDAAMQRLQIRFKSGKTYSYQNVPPSLVEELASASSPGQFFNSAIKDQFPTA